jgi:DivIVA domain-containing protein
VALDRESIVRSDFPTARRGYDPSAVDRHLEAIAAQVDDLRRRAGPGGALATQTSEQVRAIIEAAEGSAAGIRDTADADARAHVARVAEAADALRERIDALERELTAMLADVRGGAERLRRELDDVAVGSSRLAAAGAGEGASARIAPTALGATLGEAAAAAAPEAAEVEEEPALEAVDETASAPVQRSTDQVTAQLQAANMAMDGVARDDLERYLVQHYDLPDVAAVLDRAYAAAGH